MNTNSYFVYYAPHNYRSLLNKGEMAKLRAAVENNKGILKHHFAVGDGHGRNLGHVIWSHPGNDITGMIARSQKVAGFTEKVENI